MKKTQWMLYTKRADYDSCAARFSVSPILIKIMANRDMDEHDMDIILHGTIADMNDPRDIYDMDKAVSVLSDRIDHGSHIRIVGDYDIDGVCSTYILLRSLKRVGATADYEIPDRVKDGYGINENIIEHAHKDGVDTIITCDNGIAAIEAIDKAKEYGMTVIVTDHHEIHKENEREILPAADVIVDPHRADDSSEFKEICGGMVAYKLVKLLYEHYDIPESEWIDMLPYAAIATIGDVMPLTDENHIAAKFGLEAMADIDNMGLKALVDVCSLDIHHIYAYHIGFVIGPCLNAGGRLEHAKVALKLLMSETEEEAYSLATHLKELNDERKEMTIEYTEQAIREVEEKYADDKVIVLYIPECHESIAGLIAGKIKERYHKPTIVLTDTEGDVVKGSGRSIETYSMFEKLSEVSELMIKFGGHPMAAGLSLEKSKIDEFRKKLNELCNLTEEDFVEKVWIDVAMPLSYVGEDIVEELKKLEPYGQGFTKPTFAQKDVSVLSTRVMGKNRNAVKLSLRKDNTTIDGLAFTDADTFMEEMGSSKCVDILYYPQINEYMNKRSPQLGLIGWKFH